jgi:hypothetical protein
MKILNMKVTSRIRLSVWGNLHHIGSAAHTPGCPVQQLSEVLVLAHRYRNSSNASLCPIQTQLTLDTPQTRCVINRNISFAASHAENLSPSISSSSCPVFLPQPCWDRDQHRHREPTAPHTRGAARSAPTLPMDTDMEDVGRAPEPSRLSPASEPASIPTLDGWIESLMTCKQLAENDVQRLCEKVRVPPAGS